MAISPKVVVVMPAYNAARTLERTYNDLPAHVVHHIILVDDVSQDETVEIAERLGLKTVIHVQNRGYGGNQKTCYLEALKDDADVVVMLHPDYQYDSRLVPELIAPILAGQADMVLGSRLAGGSALAGGMPLWKYISNRGLTIVENLVLGQQLTECHTGFRAYSRRLLETIPFLLNSDKFVFDTEVIAQAVAFGFRIAEIPVPTRYFLRSVVGQPAQQHHLWSEHPGCDGPLPAGSQRAAPCAAVPQKPEQHHQPPPRTDDLAQDAGTVCDSAPGAPLTHDEHTRAPALLVGCLAAGRSAAGADPDPLHRATRPAQHRRRLCPPAAQRWKRRNSCAPATYIRVGRPTSTWATATPSSTSTRPARTC